MVDYKRNVSSSRSLALNRLSRNRTRQLSEPATLGSLETRLKFGMIQSCGEHSERKPRGPGWGWGVQMAVLAAQAVEND